MNIRTAVRRGLACLGAAIGLASCATRAQESTLYLDPALEPAEALARCLGGDGVPGLAVAVVKDGKIAYRETAGIRKRGDPAPIGGEDAFHIGSNTKGMTALLAAMLVDEGRLRWNSKVGEILPGLPLRDEYRDLDLDMLLSHRSGLPAELPPGLWRSFFSPKAGTAAERRRMAKAALAMKPASRPGTAFLYSNFNYVIAGLMLEAVTGESWEGLMEARIFGPLGMEGAGFGPPATAGKVDAPWGHEPAPVDPGRADADNPAALGPAGTVHANLDDALAYLGLYLDEGISADGRRLVTAASLAELERPRLEGYGLGWICLPDPAGGTILVHDGSNTTFYASFVAFPSRDFGVVVLANRGDARGEALTVALREYLVARFLR